MGEKMSVATDEANKSDLTDDRIGEMSELIMDRSDINHRATQRAVGGDAVDLMSKGAVGVRSNVAFDGMFVVGSR